MSAPERSTLAIDFDGVIHSYTSGWQGVTCIPDDPVEDVIEWLHAILDEWDVTIVSSRARTFRGRWAIRRWLREHAGTRWRTYGDSRGLHTIRVTAVKVPAAVYLDDRALRFCGRTPSEGLLRAASRSWVQSGSKPFPDVFALEREVALLRTTCRRQMIQIQSLIGRCSLREAERRLRQRGDL